MGVRDVLVATLVCSSLVWTSSAVSGADGSMLADSEPVSVVSDRVVDAGGVRDVGGGVPGNVFAPVGPVRIFDSRAGVRLEASETRRVVVADGRHVPVDATAAALTVTVVDADAPGFVSVWPSGAARPDVSVVNPDAPGDTVAASVFVPLEAGAVDVFSSTGMDVVVDVSGFFVPAVSERTSGRFVGVSQTRVLDTRSSFRFRSGDTRLVSLFDADVPVDASAVVVNVTAPGPLEPGFVSAWSGRGGVPDVSVLNMSSPGVTVANLAVVPVDNGSISLFSSADTDLLVDVTGYFTGASAPRSDAGLFVPVAPMRVLDTRQSLRPGRGSSVEAEVVRAGLPVDVGAVAATLTVTGSVGPSYATVWPSGAQRPEASTLNPSAPGATVANATVVGPLSDGRVSVFQDAGGDVLFDVTGWFTSAVDVPRVPVRSGDPQFASALAHRCVLSGGVREVAFMLQLTVVDGWGDAVVSSPASVSGSGRASGSSWFGDVVFQLPEGVMSTPSFTLRFMHGVTGEVQSFVFDDLAIDVESVICT